MNNKLLRQRIRDTQTDIFPLDRHLPLESVYTIFHNVYDKESDKVVFLNNHKYSRLREGYYSLFVALAYSQLIQKLHTLCFPSDPSNDVYIVEPNKNGPSSAYCFDVKEYTPHTETFVYFLEQKVFPRLEKNMYDIIIGIHKGVSIEEQTLICEFLSRIDSERLVYVVGPDMPNQQNEDVSRVTAITKRGVRQNEVFNLSDHYKKLDSIMVYQDLVKFNHSC